MPIIDSSALPSSGVSQAPSAPVSTTLPTDRVNPVPSGGTISINGKKPITLMMVNQNNLPVQTLVKVSNTTTGTSQIVGYPVNPTEFLALKIDLNPGETNQIIVSNISGPQIDVGFTETIRIF